MDGLICPACGDMGVRDLPVRDDVEMYPCPVCHPWPQGFPGEYVERGGRRIWIIEPAGPGEPARYVGHRRQSETL